MKTKIDTLLASQRLLRPLDSDLTGNWGIDLSLPVAASPSLDFLWQLPTVNIESYGPTSFLNDEVVKELDAAKLNLGEVFRIWLENNPSWLDENGFGGIQAQVISASDIFPSLEFPNPGQAQGFDYWYENIFSVSDQANHGPVICVFPPPEDWPQEIALQDPSTPDSSEPETLDPVSSDFIGYDETLLVTDDFI